MSSLVVSVVPVSSPVPRTTSSISLTIWAKSPVASGWKTIAAEPRVLIPGPVSSAIAAVVIAKRRSGAGPLTLLRPSSASKRPMD